MSNHSYPDLSWLVNTNKLAKNLQSPFNSAIINLPMLNFSVLPDMFQTCPIARQSDQATWCSTAVCYERILTYLQQKKNISISFFYNCYCPIIFYPVCLLIFCRSQCFFLSVLIPMTISRCNSESIIPHSTFNVYERSQGERSAWETLASYSIP